MARLSKAASMALLVAAALLLPAALADMCPQTAEYNGCLRNGCITIRSTGPGARARGGAVRSRNTGTGSNNNNANAEEVTVCDACGKGYELVRPGTARAKCNCAPGFAGRGQRGLCEACPSGTQVAPGGPIRLSRCLNCPAGMLPLDDMSTCGCPAGMYRVVLSSNQVPEGTAPYACRVCEARSAFITESTHTLATCKTCRSGLVANANHTDCVKADDPNAAPPTGLGAAVANFNSALVGARTKSEELAIERMDDGPRGVIGLTGGSSGATGGKRAQQDKVAAVNEAVPQTGGAGGLTGLLQRAGANIGASMGAIAPGRGNPVAAFSGKVDKEALKDAGLPAADNVMGLLKGVMANTADDIGDLGW